MTPNFSGVVIYKRIKECLTKKKDVH